MWPTDSSSSSAPLGAAFELRATRPASSSMSSASSSSSSVLSFTFSSTESEGEHEEHNTSFSSASTSASTTVPRDHDTPRDPLSASAKPVDGLRLYSLPDSPGSRRSRASASPPRPNTTRTPTRVRTDDDVVTPGRTRRDVSTSPITSGRSMTPRVLFGEAGGGSGGSSRQMLGAPVGMPPGSSEKEFWDTVLSNAIDNATGNLDLSFPVPRYSGGALTYIPPNIIDLRNLVVLNPAPAVIGSPQELTAPSPGSATPAGRRAFSRVSSAPASYSVAPTRTFGRATTLAPSASGRIGSGSGVGAADGAENKRPEADVRLFLAGNSIRSLPRELFSLRGLTVLSLRGNGLEYIPPAIAGLVSLNELNISQNRIKYLPAEIQQLHLENLFLTANDFLPCPPLHSEDDDADPKQRQARILAPLKRKWPSGSRGIPPLHELAYRVLLSPQPAPNFNGLLNWQMYDADEWFGADAQPHYRDVYEILKAATPAYSASDGKGGMSTHIHPHKKPHEHQDIQSGSTTPSIDPHRRELLDAAAYYPHHCPSPQHHHLPAPSAPSHLQRDEQQRRLGFGRAPSAHLPPSALRATSLAAAPAVRFASASSSASFSSTIPERASSVSTTYLAHAEERMEWVTEIAGVTLPGQTRVPILWRGCTNGCLSFLEEGEGEGNTEVVDTHVSAKSMDSVAQAWRERLAPVDSQRTIRPGDDGGFDEDDETVLDGFDIDDLDDFGA